jgi:hypothetical protein
LPGFFSGTLRKTLLYSCAHPIHARVAKLVDALVLGTSRAICGGSSPLPRTLKTADHWSAVFVIKIVIESFGMIGVSGTSSCSVSQQSYE